jgi:adenylate cyclase
VFVKQQKAKFPISLKLITIFSLLVILVLGVTTYMVSSLVRNDERIKAEENNHTINGRTAETVQIVFVNAQNNAAGLLSEFSFLPSSADSTVADNLFAAYCDRNRDTVFISGPGLGIRYNAYFKRAHPDVESQTDSWFKANEAVIQTVKNGAIEIKNVSPIYKTPVICILFPYTTSVGRECAVIAFTADKLSDLMSTGSYNTSFLINRRGEILIHPDYEKMIAGGSFKRLPAVQNMINSSIDNSQNLFPDEKGEKWFYAYHRITDNMFVVTCVTEKDVFEAINRTTYRIILFSLAIFFLSIIIIRFFSRTLTRPIGELVNASHKIEQGNFELDLKPRTKDELGLLTSSFVQMGKGLAERERLKLTFSKFTNKIVAERAASGNLALGGEIRNVTVFFTDIRSFTAMSEKMQPQEVVGFLNDYMTRMVKCVNKTGGVVDKYIGDSIMAVWGAPETTGNLVNDAWNAVKTALMMRYELHEFNKQRTAEGKSPVRIGCGINSGMVVAGQIGSADRMEYTVIGDAVNFASRTESLNKPFATDILITENTWQLVKDKVIVEQMPSVHVKGKEESVRMFAVINAVGGKNPQTIEQLRQILGVAAPELNKVDADAEEKKYTIGN